MIEVTEAIRELPLGRLLPVGLLFICGMVLWVAGRRIMRPAFAATGFVVGGMLGWALGNTAELGVQPWLAAASGGALAAVVAALAYRLALAATVGVLLASLAPMGVTAAAENGAFGDLAALRAVEQNPLAVQDPDAGSVATEPGDPTLGLPQDVAEWIEDQLGFEQEPPDTGEPAMTADGGINLDVDDLMMSPWTARPVLVIGDQMQSAWIDSPPALRGSLVAAAAFGIVLGFVIGAAAPGFSAAAVSALGGSILMLATAWIALARTGLTEYGWMASPTTWTVTWLIIALIGLGIQWTFRPKRADSAAD